MELDMKFPTLASIKSYEAVGNFHSDSAAFAAVTEFVQDERNSIADRAEALRHSEENWMGLDADTRSDEAVVAAYLSEM